MKVSTATLEFDVFELFVHDYHVALTICPVLLAQALTELVRVETLHEPWEIRAPEDTGLDRFTLWGGRTEGAGWTNKFYNKREVRNALPTKVVKALEAIDRQAWLVDTSGTPTLTTKPPRSRKPEPKEVRRGKR